MAWMIGIDEAGYGPNLGPLVMTSVACRIPERLAGADLWKVLKKAVQRQVRRRTLKGAATDRFPRKRHAARSARLIVDDSKLVYSPTRGLLDLETGVLATSSSFPNWSLGTRGEGEATQAGEALRLHEFLDWLCPRLPGAAGPGRELDEEPWYSGLSTLPRIADPSFLVRAAGRFAQTCEDKGITWGRIRSVVICPRRFNSILDQWNTKGAVLSHALAELLQAIVARSGDRVTAGEGDRATAGDADDGIEPFCLHVDKHGGRDYYTAILQYALPNYMVLAQEEGEQRSVYRLFGAARDIQLTIQPRADAEHFCVALASMVSKYLRELLMSEFNRFWQSHVPGLKPTAGYPGDAARFYQEICPIAKRLGFAEAALWRRR